MRLNRYNYFPGNNLGNNLSNKRGDIYARITRGRDC